MWYILCIDLKRYNTKCCTMEWYNTQLDVTEYSTIYITYYSIVKYYTTQYCTTKHNVTTTWNTKYWNQGQCETTISGHSDSIECVKWGGSGLLYSCSRDRTIKGTYLRSRRLIDGYVCLCILSYSHSPILSYASMLIIRTRMPIIRFT